MSFRTALAMRNLLLLEKTKTQPANSRFLIDEAVRNDRKDVQVPGHRALASTSVTSSGCSAPPIQSSTAAVTISEMRSSERSRFS
jgi:hypothetical protein